MKKASLPPLITTSLAAAILGVWKLKSRRDVDATGRIHIDPFLGRIRLVSSVLGHVTLRLSS